MSRIIFIGIFLITVLNCFGQNDSIVIKKAMGTVFQQHGKNLTPGKLLEITQSNSEAYKEMKIAKRNFDVGYVFGFAGGFMVGWPLGTAIAGGKPNWTLAGIGAGLIVVSIPFSTAYSKHAKNAVMLYNSGLKSSENNHVDLKVGMVSNGIGVQLTF